MSEPDLQQLLTALAAHQEPVYLVGGSLRHWLLNQPIKDYDFVVPNQALRLAYRLADRFGLSCFPLDKERDMGRVVMGAVTFDFAPCGPDLERDLRQRDLSINAIACRVDAQMITVLVSRHGTGSPYDQSMSGQAVLDPHDLTLIDPCGGLEDLRTGRIRGLSRENFAADPLRLLRVYRFAASLDFCILPQTEVWVQELAPELKLVAAERCLHELALIMASPRSAEWLERMQHTALLPELLPPQLLASGLVTPTPSAVSSGAQIPGLEAPGGELLSFEVLRHFEAMSAECPADVRAYLAETMSGIRTRQFSFKLATLLLQPTSGPGHCEHPSARQARRQITPLQALLERLLLSRTEIDTLLRWQQLVPVLLALNVQKPAERFHLFRQAQQDLFGLVLLVQIWLALGLLPEDCLLTLAQLNSLLDEWRNPDSVVAHPPLLLDGKALMQALDSKPGPLIGKLLLAIQEAQAEGNVVSAEDAVAFARQACQPQPEDPS